MSDHNLFSWFYVASQVQNGNLDEFFEHENQLYPPVSQNSKMRTDTKSDLVRCLEKLVPSEEIATSPSVQVILDGSAIFLNDSLKANMATLSKKCCYNDNTN